MSRLTAKRTPIHSGVAAWNAILGPQPDPPTLGDDRTADVVIVGAGFAGLSAARRLKQLQPEARIVVLDASRIAEGAAGRNSGFMIDLPHSLPGAEKASAQGEAELIAMNRQAQDFAERAVLDYGIDRSFLQRAGKISGAVDAKTETVNRDEAKHLDQIGEDYAWLDAGEMQRITGSGYYRSGLFTPGTVMLQPAGYIRGLAAGLRRKGVDIFENCPVTGFEKSGAGWSVKTPKGNVQTDRIILSVNGHLESFGVSSGRLMQLFLFGAMTPELTDEQVKAIGGEFKWGITPVDPMGSTVRRIDKAQGGNRLVIRTGAALRSDMQARPSDVEKAQRQMRKGFDARFPALAGLAMEHVWAGHLCLSKNGVSVTGQIEEGVYSACVQNGLGTARGTLTGIAAAELACGEDSDITQRFSTEPEPERLPPQPIRDLGANAVLRWKMWKARRA